MAQHFLFSAAARSLSAAKVMRMSDTGVENVFLRLRWPATDGKPVCPDCGCMIAYDCRRPEGQPRWRCKACRGDFSITSGTLFAWHKLPLRTYMLAVVAFCNEVKGKSMLALSRELDVQLGFPPFIPASARPGTPPAAQFPESSRGVARGLQQAVQQRGGNFDGLQPWPGH